MPKTVQPGAEIWRASSLLLAPIVTFVALSMFAYKVNAEGLVESRALFIGVPLLSVVANIAAPRVAAVRPIAVFLVVLTFALTVYGVSALTGLASALSFADRPTGFIALLSASWTVAALLPWPATSDSAQAATTGSPRAPDD